MQLFLSFLQIGLFSFGGGYAAMPLIQNQVVLQHGWLSMAYGGIHRSCDNFPDDAGSDCN